MTILTSGSSRVCVEAVSRVVTAGDWGLIYNVSFVEMIGVVLGKISLLPVIINVYMVCDVQQVMGLNLSS